MALTNQFGLSVKNDLRGGRPGEKSRGYWSLSGKVASSTNSKPVILFKDVGLRDSIITVTFGGAATSADINAGSASYVEFYLDDVVVYAVKVQTIDMGNPFFTEFSLFIPASSSLRIDVTDIDATGHHTTMVRGYYV
jgi:hypothetical protein